MEASRIAVGCFPTTLTSVALTFILWPGFDSVACSSYLLSHKLWPIPVRHSIQNVSQTWKLLLLHCWESCCTCNKIFVKTSLGAIACNVTVLARELQQWEQSSYSRENLALQFATYNDTMCNITQPSIMMRTVIRVSEVELGRDAQNIILNVILQPNARQSMKHILPECSKSNLGLLYYRRMLPIREHTIWTIANLRMNLAENLTAFQCMYLHNLYYTWLRKSYAYSSLISGK